VIELKIFINAGHGGIDPGAVSKNGNKEADITQKVSALLACQLIQNGFNIEFFQQANSLTDVSKTENSSNSDLFISIHCNAATSNSANGTEVLYYPTSTKGKKCAQLVQNELVKTGLKDRGIKARTDLHVLKRTKATAILVELAFLSNPTEEKLLIENPKIFVDAICTGIKNINTNDLLK
jgi:N-acetylmuramoyl-L-alanine amidase